MRIRLHKPSDLAALRERIRTEEDPVQRDRYRSVLLALEGNRRAQIIKELGRSIRFIQRWVYAYRDGGLEALAPHDAGRPARLRREQELMFLMRVLLDGVQKEDGACVRVMDAARILKDEFGIEYKPGGMYAVLYRLGLRRRKHRAEQTADGDLFAQ